MSESAESVFDPEAMLRVLAEHGVEFIVVGGVAVQTHGYLRGTTDLDIIPAPSLLNLGRLSEAFGAGDPHLLKRAPLKRVDTEFGPLDIVNIGQIGGLPRRYEEIRARAVEVDLDGQIVAVVGLDDLIRMKRVAGREVDLMDIGALTRTDEQLQDEAGEST